MSENWKLIKESDDGKIRITYAEGKVVYVEINTGGEDSDSNWVEFSNIEEVQKMFNLVRRVIRNA